MSTLNLAPLEFTPSTDQYAEISKAFEREFAIKIILEYLVTVTQTHF